MTVTPTVTASPSPTVTPTPTATPQPQPLAVFQPKLLPGVEPNGYVADRCEYLLNRWSEGKAEPGTIVVPLMYHSVVKDGRPLRDNMSVSAAYFNSTMQHAYRLGFETITTEELIGFLYHNDSIPPRSLLLIVDDRRIGVVRNHFLPVLQQYDWTVTMAYITGVMYPAEWTDLEDLNRSGYVDIQSHGFLHNGETYITKFTPEETIRSEIYNSIPLIEEHIGRRPLAFIWPGGNFNDYAVDVAREAGFEVGFTVFSRGPLQYNWIPLGTEEMAVEDPLMVLPRYWSTAAYINLDEAAALGDAAQAYAVEHRADELDWYARYCPTYPPLGGNLPPE
jgi:peptidoglycan/xylan/chitin deacetylase (PgdA/CDA1 family)